MIRVSLSVCILPSRFVTLIARDWCTIEPQSLEQLWRPKQKYKSRYTRRVLTHGARGERGARGVFVGAGGRRGEGGGKAPVGYIAVYVNVGPDGLHKHDDDVSLCLSYFSPPSSQTFHVTFFFVIRRRCRRRRHGPCVHSKMRFGPPSQTPRPPKYAAL